MLRRAAATARRIIRRHSTPPQRADAVVVGAGLVGVSTASRLASAGLRVLCVTRHPPCSYTSAVSTECYRDFWPSMEMAALMSRSIDLMEATAQGGIGLTRRGYAYCARQPETLAKAVAECEDLGGVRHHATLAAYEPAPAGVLDAFEELPAGFDVLHGAAAREAFPCLSDDVVGVVHARRTGWVDSGRYAAELIARAKAAGVTFVAGRVDGIECEGGAVAGVRVDGRRVATSTMVNCAGPYLTHIHGMVSEMELPIVNEVHAKVVFRDVLKRVPRDAPMLISLDSTRVMEDDGLEDVFGTDVAAKLTGLAPAVRCRRPSSGLQLIGGTRLDAV
jgi:glycine/D-amino acid oxidase-like deaminating enzyme